MRTTRKVLYLLLTLIAVFFIPLIALYIHKGEIPKDFFHFPAIKASPKPGNNWLVITITSLLFLAFLLLIFFPGIYGFRKVPAPDVSRSKIKLPWWFWLGAAFWVLILLLFGQMFDGPEWLMNWALLPLWWGFILILDGIVFARNNGKSLIKNAFFELVLMAFFAIPGWLIFEYFNFFIELNWYYPHAENISHTKFLIYAVVGSSAFIPMTFEWYHLYLTIPWLNRCHRHGRDVSWSLTAKIIVLLVALGILFGMTFVPDSLFYAVWLGPLTIISIVMTLLGIWTPFQPIKEKGDWTPLVLIALTWLVQGLFIESWNGLSFRAFRALHLLTSYNPGYWDYCIPYVDFGHIANMPLLGYLGYVPFSLYCCIWIYAVGFIFNIKFPFTHQNN